MCFAKIIFLKAELIHPIHWGCKNVNINDVARQNAIDLRMRGLHNDILMIHCKGGNYKMVDKNCGNGFRWEYIIQIRYFLNSHTYLQSAAL